MDSRSRYQVPDGLRPLLEALARETLRAQPNDVIRFAQLFFDELQHHRGSNPNTDIIRDPISYEMFRTDLQRRVSTFYLVDQLCIWRTTILAVPVPSIKQLLRYRQHFVDIASEKHVEKMKKEDNEAATKIQANIRQLILYIVLNLKLFNVFFWFRGFLTRKHLDGQGLLSPSRSRSSIHSSHSDVIDN
uniref:RIIa domain-containing protein n=1 Tax=Heterorhabditis bacteriophora TaxID=37862 RepID=A0A1I7WGG9_HETBA